MSWQILEGSCPDVLRELDAGSIQTCVTSPPYWGLRDYGAEGQLGLEPTPEQYVENLVAVFREVRRVLREDGTVWLNLGDSYAGSWGAQSRDTQRGVGSVSESGKALRSANPPLGARSCGQCLGNGYVNPATNTWSKGDEALVATYQRECPACSGSGVSRGLSATQIKAHPKGTHTGSWVKDHASLKPKDLVGIPWRVAFALQADGWWLRSDVIWAKPNPMPESVTDRPTRSHEYIFLLTKSARYFYDAEAVREDGKDWSKGGPGVGIQTTEHYGAGNGGNAGLSDLASRYKDGEQAAGRNRRSVWTVTTQPFPGAHFATFPPKLIEPCVLAGSPPKCCGECGAPWERVVEKPDFSEQPQRDTAKMPRSDRTSAGQAWQDWRDANPDKQLGWCPTCDHDDDSGSAIVLDPFAGAGTTGVVALRHNRNFVGIELNPEYAEMARNRIRDDAPLLNTGLEIAAVTTPETRRDF